MRRSLALLIPAVLLAACTQSPTGAARQPAVRYDGGGNYHGSGNVVGEGGPSDGGQITSTLPNTAPSDTTGATERGGINTMGSGNAVGASGEGQITSTTTNTAAADTTAVVGRGGNYFGSGN